MNETINIPITREQLDFINMGTGLTHEFNSPTDWRRLEITKGIHKGTVVLVNHAQILLISTRNSILSIPFQAYTLCKEVNLIQDDFNVTGYADNLRIEALSSNVAVLQAYFPKETVEISHQEINKSNVLPQEVMFVSKRHRH